MIAVVVEWQHALGNPWCIYVGSSPAHGSSINEVIMTVTKKIGNSKKSKEKCTAYKVVSLISWGIAMFIAIATMLYLSEYPEYDYKALSVCLGAILYAFIAFVWIIGKEIKRWEND